MRCDCGLLRGQPRGPRAIRLVAAQINLGKGDHARDRNFLSCEPLCDLLETFVDLPAFRDHNLQFDLWFVTIHPSLGALEYPVYSLGVYTQLQNLWRDAPGERAFVHIRNGC